MVQQSLQQPRQLRPNVLKLQLIQDEVKTKVVTEAPNQLHLKRKIKSLTPVMRMPRHRTFAFQQIWKKNKARLLQLIANSNKNKNKWVHN